MSRRVEGFVVALQGLAQRLRGAHGHGLLQELFAALEPRRQGHPARHVAAADGAVAKLHSPQKSTNNLKYNYIKSFLLYLYYFYNTPYLILNL